MARGAFLIYGTLCGACPSTSSNAASLTAHAPQTEGVRARLCGQSVQGHWGGEAALAHLRQPPSRFPPPPAHAPRSASRALASNFGSRLSARLAGGPVPAGRRRTFTHFLLFSSVAAIRLFCLGLVLLTFYNPPLLSPSPPLFFSSFPPLLFSTSSPLLGVSLCTQHEPPLSLQCEPVMNACASCRCASRHKGWNGLL